MVRWVQLSAEPTDCAPCPAYRHTVAQESPRMTDKDKTRDQLIAELTELRQRVAQAESSVQGTARPSAEPPIPDPLTMVHRSPAVTFVWRAGDGWPVSFVSEGVRRYGHLPQDLVGLTRHDLYVAREDLPSFLATFTEAGGSASSRSFTREYRLLTHAGEGRWVRERMWVERDAQGTITHFTGLLSDIHDLRQLEAVVEEQNQRLSALFEHATQPILLHDAHGRCLDANRAACDYLGYSHDELLQVPLDVLLGSEAAARALRLAQGPAARREAALETELVAGDGSRLPVVLACRVTDLDGGRALLTAIQEGRARTPVAPPPVSGAVEAPQGRVAELEDALRRLQEERDALSAEVARCEEQRRRSEVMLRDVHHRVKNNLQVIASLLGLQAEYVQDRRVLEALADSQNRVRAMALVHERIYQSQDLATVDLGAYLRDLAERLFAALGADANVTLDVDAEPIALSMDAAIPCGLLVSELVSNSIKHAFPGGRRGTVRITLHRHDGEIQLTVADDGVGLPDGFDYRHADSLGLQLVDILAQQLGATVDANGSAGLCFVFTFPDKG